MATTSAKDLGIEPGVWNLDAAHSSVEFTVRHLMVSKVRGHFEKFTASVTIDEDVTKSSVTASIEAGSITTRDEARDNHLRSADFFESDKYPTIEFASTAIRPNGDDWKLLGNLTIRGVTKPIELDLEFNGTQADPYGGVRTGFSATGELSRKDFGIEWNAAVDGGGVVVGDKITINLEAELVKA
ncbi:YceI family protein [Ferrimicrobium sp.]|uniref:YceI family protein n=1 Tax=Ferrimicrobium sp. TaxID=2926050 RepID=UPI00260838B5|nr:YceI family protein [Ferrimicrobium sp.]